MEKNCGKKVNDVKNTDKEKLYYLLKDFDMISDQLAPWLKEENIFQILKLSRTEIRHSNFLAYLFNPKEGHGMKDYFLKSFLKICLKMDQYDFIGLDYFDIVLADYEDIEIFREHKDIDLLLISQKNKMVLCIENKTISLESKHQLNKYKSYVEENYKEYNRIFVFLTPEGIEPSDEEWCIVSYYDVALILERLLKLNQLESKISYIINDYLNVLRSDLLVDEKLREICRKIYAEHQDALDLIFENRPDNLSLMSELYVEALAELANEKNEEIKIISTSKTMIRFQTKRLNQLFPDLPENFPGGWNNHKPYGIELYNKSESISGRIKIAFTGKIDPDGRQRLERILTEVDGGRKRKDTWEWWGTGNWKIAGINNKFVEDIFIIVAEEGREKIVSKIKNNLEKTLIKIDQFVDRIEGIAENTRLK